MGAVAAVSRVDTDPDVGIVERMLGVAPHRGPRRDVLVHGRTALGLSDDPSLPDGGLILAGGYALALCGIIDNADDLRRDLLDAGLTPGDSDAAVVLAGWRSHGDAFLAGLRGHFTGVISDGRGLVCFRDHFGFKSLFFHTDARGLTVATEVKQVVAGTGIPAQPDLDVVERIFYRDLEDETATYVRGVSRLAKSSVLRQTARGTTVDRYWRPERLLEAARLSPGEVQAQFDRLMEQAVRRCLGPDTVISLSGGIDSPTVASYAAPLHRATTGRPLPALSIVAPQHPAVDESDYIRDVVDFLDIGPWHTYEQRAPVADGLTRWIELCDGPIPAVVPNQFEEHLLHARRAGYRTILTGELAEFVIDRPDGLLVHLLLRGRGRALVRTIRRKRADGRSRRAIARELGSAVVSQRRTARRRVERRIVSDPPPWIDRRRYEALIRRRAVSPRRRWRTRQTELLVGPGVTLEGFEIMEAVAGVRLRRPWLDVDLWEFLLSLPAEVKYDGSKRRKPFVRDHVRGRVPDRILDRRDKTVFDDALEAAKDYDELKRWLAEPTVRFAGIDYATLQHRLERQAFDIWEFMWARDLAAAHAFVEMAEGRADGS